MRSTFALLAVVFAGCGAGSPAASPDLSPMSNAPAFIGGWTSTSSETEVCPNGSHVTPLNGVLPVVAGTTAFDIVTQSPNGCNLTWTVDGNTATLKGTQMCTVAGSVGGTWTATFNTGTLVLAGSTITFSDQGSGVLAIAGQNYNCTFTQSGSWLKN
jgi:hypothetical protein